MIISRHVYFDELVFPFKQVVAAPPPSPLPSSSSRVVLPLEAMVSRRSRYNRRAPTSPGSPPCSRGSPGTLLHHLARRLRQAGLLLRRPILQPQPPILLPWQAFHLAWQPIRLHLIPLPWLQLREAPAPVLWVWLHFGQGLVFSHALVLECIARAVVTQMTSTSAPQPLHPPRQLLFR